MADWRSLGLDFNTLRVFKAAVEEKSFAGAAEREHLAASAISRRISEMEARLGIALLRRHDRGVEPTPAGEILMRHVESLFDIVEVTLSDLESLTLGRSGQVRIGASLSMISSSLPTILGQIKEAHPGLDLRLKQLNSEESLRDLERGSIDIGFVSGIDVNDSVTAFEFLSEPLVVVLPKNHILAELKNGIRLDNLKGCDYVGLRPDLGLQALVERKAFGQTVDLRVKVTVDGFDSIAKCVSTGLGLSIMPKGHALEAEKVHDISVLPLLEDWAVRKTYVCVKSVSNLAPAAKIVLDAITKNKATELN